MAAKMMMIMMLALVSAHTLDKDGAKTSEALRESNEVKGFDSAHSTLSAADDSDTVRDIRAAGDTRAVFGLAKASKSTRDQENRDEDDTPRQTDLLSSMAEEDESEHVEDEVKWAASCTQGQSAPFGTQDFGECKIGTMKCSDDKNNRTRWAVTFLDCGTSITECPDPPESWKVGNCFGEKTKPWFRGGKKRCRYTMDTCCNLLPTEDGSSATCAAAPTPGSPPAGGGSSSAPPATPTQDGNCFNELGDDVLECMNGQTCTGDINGQNNWACCKNMGSSRKSCPKNWPFMCNRINDHCGGGDRCCQNTAAACGSLAESCPS